MIRDYRQDADGSGVFLSFNDAQLDLFAWDRMRCSQGFSALERLDFAAAKRTFDAVLSQYPGHLEASFGNRLILDWKDAIETAGDMTTEEAAVFLMPKIKGYDFMPTGSNLKCGLNSYLTTRMAHENCLFIPPDIYIGDLYLEAGEYGKAEGAFAKYLEQDPLNGRTIISLGNSLWMQEKTDEARHVYAKAFLLAPAESNPEDLKDETLKKTIHRTELAYVPIHGWLEGLLPLMEDTVAKPQNAEHEKALAIYSCINLAEKARIGGAYSKMIEARRRMKELSPEIFEAYMERISGNR